MPNELSTVSPFEDVKEIVESERKRILIRFCTLWPDRFTFLLPFIAELETQLESFPIHLEGGPLNGFELFPDMFEWMKAWLEGRTYPNWGLPEDNLLAGLTEQQLYLLLVKRELHDTRHFLSGEALEYQSVSASVTDGIRALISCERALSHAEQLFIAKVHKMKDAPNEPTATQACGNEHPTQHVTVEAGNIADAGAKDGHGH